VAFGTIFPRLSHYLYRPEHLPVHLCVMRFSLYFSPDILPGGSVIPYIHNNNYLEYFTVINSVTGIT